MIASENDTPRPRPLPPEERLLVTDEAGHVRPIIVWLLVSMAFTAVAVLRDWPVAFTVGGGVGVVIGWAVLALERKRRRAAIEARQDDEAPSER